MKRSIRALSAWGALLETEIRYYGGGAVAHGPFREKKSRLGHRGYEVKECRCKEMRSILGMIPLGVFGIGDEEQKREKSAADDRPTDVGKQTVSLAGGLVQKENSVVIQSPKRIEKMSD